MSQYMANEMAKQGKSYTEILQYFFEGTELSEVADIVLGDVGNSGETTVENVD